ncbi:EAL domain-containing protein [Sedimentitalea nanhaiensis]|uniref:EAL domain, c-di-GMP-specific phosphodiesterase class I (Or its enzymatically inactive variant) n=1 Tax=Sedimentitalea nanhaiensis TaxID=999627 RepID=A0A1I7CQ41_9RHOB|nr:EAL domain-containing protein [Sedimentitalea nanhaiensis]SFU01523.1 EAL domain, c-di-GMP-specific phosphodiesterase class I (or its enzymatically inactive variant) [Sedimentitalea nanhaiensis]
MLTRRKMYADVPAGQYSPLEAAVGARDGGTIEMVEQAVRHRQTMLAYQPVMQAHPPHQTAFYEGLIRILDDTGRVVPARDFLPMVENTELGREIDCVTLETGLRTLAENPSVRLSLNMSARSIGYKRWMRILDRHLNKDQTLGERLMLEISEASAMTVPELVIDFMDRLQDRSIGFALDDFGGGMTAFRYLKDFFFDAVKIDSQFVRGVHADADNQSVVRALIAVAKQFDMLIIANQVETVEDAEFLAANGVDCLQGYLFGAPTVRPPWIPEGKSATG